MNHKANLGASDPSQMEKVAKKNKIDYLNLVKECVKCEGKFDESNGNHQSVKCYTYRASNNGDKSMAIATVKNSSTDLLNGVLFSTDIGRISDEYKIDVDDILSNKGEYDKFLARCICLDGYYTLNYLVTTPCNEQEKEPGKIYTTDEAKGAAKSSLKNIIKQIMDHNQTASIPIEFLIFHAAGNPFDPNGALAKYYKHTFGLKCTLGVYPFLMDTYEGVTQELISSDRKNNNEILNKQIKRYESLKIKYDDEVIRLKNENEKMLVCNIQKWLDDVEHVSPLQLLFIGTIQEINDKINADGKIAEICKF